MTLMDRSWAQPELSRARSVQPSTVLASLTGHFGLRTVLHVSSVWVYVQPREYWLPIHSRIQCKLASLTEHFGLRTVLHVTSVWVYV